MTKRSLPTPEELRQLLRYEPDTGRFYWKPRPLEFFEGGKYPAERLKRAWESRFLGEEAMTCSNPDGYKTSHISGVTLKAHRVAWAIYYGEWPDDEIDHINCNRADNRIENLRQCRHYENCSNGLVRKTNKSGYKGVSWDREQQKWRAQITARGEHKNLGRFDCPVAAHKAYREAAALLHRNFARFC